MLYYILDWLSFTCTIKQIYMDFLYYRDVIRYEYSHEVLPEAESKFKGQIIPKDRRISIILRNEPNEEDTK